MEIIKRSSIFDDNSTVVLNDDEMTCILTALEMMGNIYNQAISTHGEDSIATHEKEVFKNMMELHSIMKKEWLD